jgi:DNA-binding transcriptional MerR regulator
MKQQNELSTGRRQRTQPPQGDENDMNSTQAMNINEASKACGLSPSVLRIWELRYGWPNPKRKTNGYRAYNQHQVQELKRAADLVKNGTPISTLIIDGLPRWPADNTHKRIVANIVKAKQLPKPRGYAEAKIQEEIIENLERRRDSNAIELLQRALWSVRPDEEVLTSLAPTIIGLEELAAVERPLPEDHRLRTMVKDRASQLLRRYRTDSPALWIVAATPADQALATLAALILNQRGHQAQVWTESDRPTSAPYLVAGTPLDTTTTGTDRRLAGYIDAVGGKDTPGIIDLINCGPTLPTSLMSQLSKN